MKRYLKTIKENTDNIQSNLDFKGVILEFKEGKSDHNYLKMIGKLVSLERMNKYLSLENEIVLDRKFNDGFKGYDKAYVDFVFEDGEKAYRAHIARIDLGDAEYTPIDEKDVEEVKRLVQGFINGEKEFKNYIYEVNPATFERIREFKGESKSVKTIEESLIKGDVYFDSKRNKEFEYTGISNRTNMSNREAPFETVFKFKALDGKGESYFEWYSKKEIDKYLTRKENVSEKLNFEENETGKARGSYVKKKRRKDDASYIYDELEKLGYQVFANGNSGYYISKRNEKNLDKAKSFLDQNDFTSKMSKFRDRFYLDIEVPGVAMGENLNKADKRLNLEEETEKDNKVFKLLAELQDKLKDNALYNDLVEFSDLRLIKEDNYIWLTGELSYEELEVIAEELNTIVEKYYKDAYFEAEDSGRWFVEVGDYLDTQTVSDDPIKMAYKDAKMSYETGHWIDLSTEEDIEQLITEMMKEENWSRVEAEKYVNEYIRLFDDKDFLDDEDLDRSLKEDSTEKELEFYASTGTMGRDSSFGPILFMKTKASSLEDAEKNFEKYLLNKDVGNKKPKAYSSKEDLEKFLGIRIENLDSIVDVKDESLDESLKENTSDFNVDNEVKKIMNSADERHPYMMLDRLVSDCKYFLGYGNGYEKHLWAGNVENQVALIKALWNALPEKPEWLSSDDINNYEKEMLDKKYSKVEESLFTLVSEFYGFHATDASKEETIELIENKIVYLSEHDKCILDENLDKMKKSNDTIVFSDFRITLQ